MDFWQLIGLVLICWWTISTIVKNHRYFRALKAEGKSIMPNFEPLLTLVFLPRIVAKQEREWVDRTLEQENHRQSAQ